MEYFVKEATVYDGDNVGVATSFAYMLNSICTNVTTIQIPPSSPYSFLRRPAAVETVNLGSISAVTSYLDRTKSFHALYEELPISLKTIISTTFFCPKCQQYFDQFTIYAQTTQTVLQTANSNFCGLCHCPLDLIKAPAFIIIQRCVSEFQYGYEQICEIPTELLYYRNDIAYQLHHITTNDRVNDICQNLLVDRSRKMYFNRDFVYDDQRYDLDVELQFVCQVNKYSQFLSEGMRTQPYYNFMKKQAMEQYLKDCSYGDVQRMFGKAEFLFYEAKNYNTVKCAVPDIFVDTGGDQTRDAASKDAVATVDSKHENKNILQAPMCAGASIRNNNVPTKDVYNMNQYKYLTEEQVLRQVQQEQKQLRGFEGDDMLFVENQRKMEVLNKQFKRYKLKRQKYRGWL